MNANELAVLTRELEEDSVDYGMGYLTKAADMLRQQQAEIEALNRELLRYKSSGEMGYANEQ